jgi:cell division protein FtsB
MTFIQPNKNKSFLNVLSVLLGIGVLCGVFFLVAFYNTTVDLNHSISDAKAELDAISAQNTNLHNTIIAALGSDQITAYAAANNLVEDKNPQYFSVDQKWLLASQY